MKPRCQVCGIQGQGSVQLTTELLKKFSIQRTWMCERGHEFTTLEVPPTFAASKNFRTSAERVIIKRISRWKRDQRIKAQYASGRTHEQLALAFDLTKTRIGQILK